ncbi:molybdopterin-containing oxidoreductase family protein [Bradyrhizobium sp. 23AC]
MAISNKGGAQVFATAPGQDGAHLTYCRLCEAQCGLVAQVKNGRIVKVRPDEEHVTSAGHLCVKGPAMASVTHDPDRVLSPLRRKGGPGDFEPVSWEEALDDIAKRLHSVLELYGSGAVATYSGNPASFATMHYSYTRMFGAALGSKAKAFSAMHTDTASKILAQELVYGTPVPVTFPDLEDCDFLMMLGANPMVSHMSLVSEPRVRQKLAAIHQRGRVVVVDPRRTETARLFEHLPIRPDTDAWLIAAMLQHIFASGLEDRKTLEQRSEGAEQLREAVKPITPERASSYCGVPSQAIRSLAVRFAQARTAACYGRVGVCRGRYATLVNVLIELLNVVTGRFGQAGGWVSGMSPLQADGGPRTYPAYGSKRSRIGDLPLIIGSSPGGSLADEITTGGPDQMRVLFMDSGNPVASYPQGDQLAGALEQLDMMVALDLYITETTRHAHYILPSPTFYERDDLTDMWVANAPRPWIQYVGAVLPPLGKARLEFDVYDAILQRLGLPSLLSNFASSDTPRPRLMEAVDRALRAGVYGDRFGERSSGLSLARLRDEFPHGVRLSDRVDAAASWARLRTPDGKIRLWHPVFGAEFARLQGAATDEDGPLRLIGRRKLPSMNSWMHNVERLVRSDRPTLLMNPLDAETRGIHDGTRVKITSSFGSIEVEVELSTDMIAGAVSYPHGWGNRGGWTHAASLPGANVNLLASSRPQDWEQISGMIHLDGVPVIVLPV